MSKIIKHSNSNNPLSHYVQTSDGKYWYVDSQLLPWRGKYETMVFEATDKCKVRSWMGVYANILNSEDEMKEEHERLINNLENYI